MPLPYNLRKLVWGLILLSAALGLRVGAAWWWEQRTQQSGKPFAFGDSEGYWKIAGAIAHGEPYQVHHHRVFRTPGYPLVLAPLFWMSGAKQPPVMWARVEGAVLGTIAVGLIVLMAWMLFDERTAWIAGLIATFYPGQIASSVFVLSEAPFIPLMLGHLFAWQRAISTQESGRWHWRAWAIGAGVCCGLAVLMRPSWLLFVPFAALIAQMLSRDWLKQMQIVAVMLAATCVVLLPWWIRNFQVTGRFVPTTLQVGASLYDGLSPDATGGSDMKKIQAREKLRFLIAGATPQTEVELDQQFRREAMEWALSHPGAALQLAVNKFGRMWNIVPNASEFGSQRIRIIYTLTYLPLMVGCIVGLWKFRQRGFAVWLLFLPAPYFTLLHMIFVASIRYQQPALAAWMILAAAAVASFLPSRKS